MCEVAGARDSDTMSPAVLRSPCSSSSTRGMMTRDASRERSWCFGRLTRPCLIAAFLWSPQACAEAETVPEPGAPPVRERPWEAPKPRPLQLEPWLTWLDVGSEPRRVLAYTPGLAAREVELVLHTEQRPYFFMADWTPENTTPRQWSLAIREARFGILERDDETDRRVAEEVAKRYEGMVRRVNGRSASTFEVQELGDGETVSSVADILDAFIVPLPPSPIGLGARWTMLRVRPCGDMQAVETRTFELGAIEDNRADIVMQGETRLSRVTPLAALEGGHVEGRVAIRGNLVVRLDDILAESGTVTVVESMRSRFPGANSPESTTNAAHHRLERKYVFRLEN
jgi:hypothetical protein